MKKISLFLSAVLVMIIFTAAAPIFKCNNRKAAFFKKKTSEKVVEAVKGWKIESVMLLDPLKDDGDKIQGFTIISSDTVEQNTMNVFRGLLLDSDNFKKGNIVKNSTFLPDYACRFANDGEYVDVLVALYCDDIKIYHNDKVHTLDITPSHAHFADFIKGVFPQDNFIRKY